MSNFVKKLRQASWISIEDDLPKRGEYVLVTNGSVICEAFLRTITGSNPVWLGYRLNPDSFDWEKKWVTHWMPFPEVPV